MSGGSPSRARRRPLVLPLLLSLVLALGIVLGLPVRAAADGPTPFSNDDPITIPGIGAAAPLPLGAGADVHQYGIGIGGEQIPGLAGR